MVDAYVRAGFTKLHLDTSMGCAGEPAALPDATHRRARRRPRRRRRGRRRPAAAGLRHRHRGPGPRRRARGPRPPRRSPPPRRRSRPSTSTAAPSPPAASTPPSPAPSRVVVQPGVEFGNEEVIVYRPEKARALSAALDARCRSFVFEAHSTDYQPPEALAALVRDGFAILKVGPGLTFALREALYGLDQIAADLDGEPAVSCSRRWKRLMLANPGHWQKYYHGTPDELRLQRHFSYSDRIRYYWPEPGAQAAVDRLLARLDGRRIPETLVSQYLGALYPDVASGQISPEAGDLRDSGRPACP